MPNKMLNLAIDGDILELAVMRRMYEMAKKEEYLKQHSRRSGHIHIYIQIGHAGNLVREAGSIRHPVWP